MRVTRIASNTEWGLPGLGFPRWEVHLLKARNGNPGSWVLEWAVTVLQRSYQPRKKNCTYRKSQQQLAANR